MLCFCNVFLIIERSYRQESSHSNVVAEGKQCLSDRVAENMSLIRFPYSV